MVLLARCIKSFPVQNTTSRIYSSDRLTVEGEFVSKLNKDSKTSTTLNCCHEQTH